jgi:hypothetical protein
MLHTAINPYTGKVHEPSLSLLETNRKCYETYALRRPAFEIHVTVKWNNIFQAVHVGVR